MVFEIFLEGESVPVGDVVASSSFFTIPISKWSRGVCCSGFWGTAEYGPVFRWDGVGGQMVLGQFDRRSQFGQLKRHRCLLWASWSSFVYVGNFRARSWWMYLCNARKTYNIVEENYNQWPFIYDNITSIVCWNIPGALCNPSGVFENLKGHDTK